MKKIFTVFAFAGILSAACTKEAGPATEPDVVPAQKYEVTVGLSNVDLQITESKASTAATEAEKKVDDAYIIVYASDGTLVDYRTWSGASVKFALEAGTYQFYAAVNTGMQNVPESLAAFKALTGSLKDDLSGFTMLGYTEKVISVGNETFSITAKRLASKIVLENVKVNFSAVSLQDEKMTVNAVYLINVAGDLSFESNLAGTVYSPTLWYNQTKYVSGDCDSYLYAGSIGTQVAHGATAPVEKTFYAYPNGTASDAHGGTFGPRKTRLVIEATIEGETCYYPFTFEQLESNKIYTITSITVTRRGVDDPDEVWSSDEVSGNLTIDDWTNGGEYSEVL